MKNDNARPLFQFKNGILYQTSHHFSIGVATTNGPLFDPHPFYLFPTYIYFSSRLLSTLISYPKDQSSIGRSEIILYAPVERRCLHRKLDVLFVKPKKNEFTYFIILIIMFNILLLTLIETCDFILPVCIKTPALTKKFEEGYANNNFTQIFTLKNLLGGA